MSTHWTTPEDLESLLRRRWQRGEFLSAMLREEPAFPLRLALKRPSARQLMEDFTAVRDWIGALRAGEGCYRIEWQELRHRQLGRQRLPRAVVFTTGDDLLRFLGRRREAQRFRRLAAETLERFPELREWLVRRPFAALAEADAWAEILQVLEWFRAHPRPGCYLRQLDIPGLDTKFIESRKGILTALLDRVLPEQAIDRRHTGVRGFERRYGLKTRPVTVRFRLLDPRHALRGLTDLSVPAEEFARLDLPVTRVFITENEINGLAFPAQRGAMVVFGLGYGVETLAAAAWLGELPLYYWGDIDTHGFAILSRLRHHFPAARSLLMDRATLLAHRALWGAEDKPFTGELGHLDQAEAELYDDLRRDRLGCAVRLEQERIRYGHLSGCLRALDDDLRLL